MYYLQARDASLRAAEAEDDASALGGGAPSAPGGPGGPSLQGAQRKPTGSIDLQSIAFHQGGHLMANAKVKLPDGAQRIETKASLISTLLTDIMLWHLLCSNPSSRSVQNDALALVST